MMSPKAFTLNYVTRRLRKESLSGSDFDDESELAPITVSSIYVRATAVHAQRKVTTQLRRHLY